MKSPKNIFKKRRKRGNRSGKFQEGVQSVMKKKTVIIKLEGSSDEFTAVCVHAPHLICSVICSTTRCSSEATPSMTSRSFSSSLSTSSCSLSDGRRFILPQTHTHTELHPLFLTLLYFELSPFCTKLCRGVVAANSVGLNLCIIL